jgi:hypothetical protein
MLSGFLPCVETIIGGEAANTNKEIEWLNHRPPQQSWSSI